MRYVWSAEKDAKNKAKHGGLALADGIPALQDPNAEEWEVWEGDEWRTITLGMNGPRLLFVVTHERTEDTIRIISVRKAEKHEEKWYFDVHP